MPEMRIALTVENFEAAVDFYQNGLGLKYGEKWQNDGNGQLLWAGTAGLEIFDEGYAARVDHIETERRISGPVRLAFDVEVLEESLKKCDRTWCCACS